MKNTMLLLRQLCDTIYKEKQRELHLSVHIGKLITHVDPAYAGTYYYFVNNESSKLYNAFCIKNRKRGVDIDM